LTSEALLLYLDRTVLLRVDAFHGSNNLQSFLLLLDVSESGEGKYFAVREPSQPCLLGFQQFGLLEGSRLQGAQELIIVVIILMLLAFLPILVGLFAGEFSMADRIDGEESVVLLASGLNLASDLQRFFAFLALSYLVSRFLERLESSLEILGAFWVDLLFP
jgi:hypothetical protein